MSSRKEYEMLFQLNAQLSGSYNSTFSKAQSQLVSMQKEIQALSKTQGDISAYQKQQTAVESTRSKLAVLQQQYDNIQREIKETEGYSSSLENKLLSKQQQIERITASLNEQTAKLDRMGDALRDAGVDTDNLTKESAELSAKIHGLKDKQEEAAESARKFGNNSVNALEEVQAAMAALGIARLYKEIAEEIVECTKASIEFESAITGVYKTVDGTEEQLAAISQGIKDMSTEIPATTTEISSVAEAAGQLGIATEDVLSFTRVMIDLGESTNLTADDAASALAKFANITGTAATDYSRLGSVVVDLGNNFATTEADIVAMSTRLASAGTLAGFSEAEIMALAAAMSSVGIEAEAGGTAMTQTLSTIEKAVAESGETVVEFARISGMSVSEFSQAWEERPIEALQAFIAGLGNLGEQGESAVLVLDELGLTGIRQSNMLKSLGLAADTLGNSIATANKAWDENTALSIEANKRYATTESQLAMLQNSYNNLQVAIGDVYAPTLREVSELGSDILADVTEFIKNNPEVIKLLTALGVGVGAFVAALVGYIAVSKLAKAATNALTAAMNANPYLLAASAIIAVVSAVATLAITAAGADEEIVKLTATAEKQQKEIEQLTEDYEELCAAGKENTEEAYYLKFQIDSLTESFEGQKQTVEEYIAECEELNNAWNESLDTNRDNSDSLETNEGRTLALIHKLQELASQTDKTVATQQEMKAIIDELNEALPGLGLNYDDVKNGVGELAEVMERRAKAESDVAKAEQYLKSMREADSTKYKAEQKLLDIQEQRNLEAAESVRLEELYNKYRSASINWVGSGGRGGNPYEEDVRNYKAAWKASQQAVEDYDAKIKEVNETIATATSDYDTYLKKLLETSGVTIESVDNIGKLESAVASASIELKALAAEYELAYVAAKESFEGQYTLFDEAKANMESTVSSAQAALDSQLKYWESYAKNVETIRSVSAEDLGVTKENYEALMAYAQSGTEEAAGLADSMAKAIKSGNKEAIADLAKTLGEVQEAQKKAAGEVAAWQVDLEGKTAEIEKTMKEAVEGLDLSDEAMQAASATMNSYINELIADGDQAVAIAAAIAAKIQAALETGVASSVSAGIKAPGFTGTSGNTVYAGYSASGLQQELRDLKRRNSNGTYNDLISQMETWLKANGYAKGTNNATRGFHLVGENGPELLYFNGGEHVLDAEETAAMQGNIQLVAMAPQLMAALNAYDAYTSADRTDAVGGYHVAPISIQVTFQIEGNPTPETVEALNEYGDDFAERVLEIIEDAGIDVARRSYT